MKIKVRNLYNENVIEHNQSIEVQNGKIVNITSFEGEDYDYENLAAALVDIHINGGEKYHFTAYPTEEALKDLEESSLKTGVGYVMPALVTSSPENIFNGIDSVRKYMQDNPHSGILGLHLEGPFISKKKRGAHIERYVRMPDDEIIKEIIDRGKGVVKMITLAPENFTDSQLKLFTDSDIKVSLGHSNCTYQRAMEAFDMGINLVTHLFNAMSPLTHREPGLAGAALSHPNVYTPLILDGDHVAFEVAKLALNLKGDKLFFISDALFLNHVKQSFQWEEFDAKLINGKYINSDGNLAGATISQADCVRNGVNILGLSLSESLHKSTAVPADVFGFKVGKIKPGYLSRFITFDAQTPDFRIINA